jgi:hypothetical protein
MLYHSINNGGCGFLLLWLLFVRNFLKVKYLELNPSSGHCGYKSHNFNVIPEKIKALVPVCSDDQLDPNPEFRSVPL